MENKPISRRDMFRYFGTAGLATVLGGMAAQGAANEPAAAQPKLPQVPRRILGKTGQSVPILLMGGMMDFNPKFDPRLAECFRFGVNYLDEADCYQNGTSEVRFGEYLANHKQRKDWWITTKSCDKSPAGLYKSVNRSLEKMKVEHVELVFMHALQDPKQLNDEMKATAARLKKEGKIHFFGFSCHNKNVAELLELSATLPWIDVVMFRYNFRDYGNDNLNRAIDAAHKAKVGLIAMKTQGSGVSFEDRVKKFESDRFTRPQAVLKAVWQDERISAAVSQMNTFEITKENIAAALNRQSLSAVEMESLKQYAESTKHLYCAGCEHICNAAVPAGIQIGTTLRYLMYHDTYGETELARYEFANFPVEARQIGGVDYTQASALCPHKIDIAKHMERAAQVLA
jgi:uncharacterized protein